MEEKTHKSIDKKLDAIIKLLAGNLIQGKKNKTETIITLANLGIEANIIADIVQTAPKTVYARLSEQKKKKKKKVSTTAKKTRKVEVEQE